MWFGEVSVCPSVLLALQTSKVSSYSENDDISRKFLARFSQQVYYTFSRRNEGNYLELLRLLISCFPACKYGRSILLPLFSFLPHTPVKDNHYSNRHIKCGNGSSECDIMICLDKLYVAGINGNCSLSFNIRPCINPGWP